MYEALSKELAQPSFYDEVNAFMFRTIDGHEKNYPRPSSMHRMKRCRKFSKVENCLRKYRRVLGAHELGEKLVDLEDYFRRWRFNHVTTVEPVIGFKRGTDLRRPVSAQNAER